ncbi:hypothetical protein KY320_02660, partial [Candidatus Woesearchaeota archaeon]|nr:hypothetical protein [Candidatus Woesearchaeota archaeon]
MIIKYTERPVPTPMAVAQGTATITIWGDYPQIGDIFINNNTVPACKVYNGTVQINTSVTDLDGEATINNVSYFYYSGLGSSDDQYIGFEVYDGNIFYEEDWDTSSVEDGIYFKVMIAAFDNSQNPNYKTTSGYFAINNIDEEPDWEEFKCNLSTNLTALANPSALGDWSAVSDLVLGVSNVGMLNMSGQTVNVDGINLSRHINITRHKISMDSYMLPCMNLESYLHFINVSLFSPVVFRNNVVCPPAICTIVHDDVDLIVKVTGFTTYEVTDGNTSINLVVWDSTDKGVYGGNETPTPGDMVRFYANFTEAGEPVHIGNKNCWARFNLSNMTSWGVMNYINPGIYVYNRSFTAPGIFDWQVMCNSTETSWYMLANDTVNISNNAPIMLASLPNITMPEDRVRIWVDLDDYFLDPDGDALNFRSTNVPNVNIIINQLNIVLIQPDANWYGNRSFYIIATDPYNASVTSNRVLLTVINMPEPPGTTETASGGGGGGGGGTRLQDIEDLELIRECIENWICSNWSACVYLWPEPNSTNHTENTGIQTRNCYDENRCGYEWNRPEEIKSCFYKPTCSDSIVNQDEEGVDCGGSCPPCPTCSDGIQNQGESDIDCGGPCPPCSTCFDGIKNCHHGECEEEVDCGGPCAECTLEEMPSYIPLLFAILWISVLVFMLFFIVYVLFGRQIRATILKIQAALRRMRAPPEIEVTIIELKEEILGKLQLLETKLATSRPDDVLKQLNTLMRDYFKIVLKIEYEFTWEELLKEINKQKIPTLLKTNLRNFIRKLIALQYGKSQTEKNNVMKLVKEARQIVELLAVNLPKEEVLITRKADAEHKSKLPMFYKLSMAATKHLADSDHKQAADAFNQALKIFNTMSKKEKGAARDKITKLREEIMN